MRKFNFNLLSKRLILISKYIIYKSRIIDIGSDHSYLPIFLILKRKNFFVIATEKNKKSYNKMNKIIRKYGLEKKILTRCAFGLNAIKFFDKINIIIICGMGGKLICKILNLGLINKNINGNERLILQANNNEYLVRKWLFNNKYCILYENILKENNFFYEIIIAEKKKDIKKYNFYDLYFGPKLIKKKNSIFIEKLNFNKKKIEENLLKMFFFKKKKKILFFKKNYFILKRC